MDINRCQKEAFAVIGKEGSTNDGDRFIQRLWEDANSHFGEVQHLAKKDGDGNIAGIWGAMSDLSRTFQPWQENFTKGLYLAGIEVENDAEAPEGWTKWTIPRFEYLYIKCVDGNEFSKVIAYIKENGLELAGAAHDFNCPKENGQAYMFFPIRKL